MKKILNRLTNKAICAVFVVLGAFTAGAELVKTPILQTFEGEAEPVSVGYTVTGLGDFKNEVAVVFTNHTKTATWTVPETLENVQFLVVGGGGGGGGGTWGPGGGGGGVVTGYVYKLEKDVVVDVFVGDGGKGGTSNTGTNNPGKKGADSEFKVYNVEYVRAYAGGASGSKGTSNKNGGSGAGAIPNSSNVQYGGSATKGTYNVELVKGWEFGNGGGTNTIKSTYTGAGGGGALRPGGNCRSSNRGGIGGEGLSCSIIGTSVVFGSGGGGGGSGAGGSGGTNAGSGGSNSGNATSAVANCGGGGGGGGKNSSAGNKGGVGGSGIVVFRYATSGGTVDFTKIEEVAAQEYPYTGENQLVLNETSAYTVSYEGGVVPNNVNEYSAVITLKDGFVWADEYTENSRTVTIKIVKVNDEWISEPSISKTAWSNSDAAGELTEPATKFNADLQVVISKKDDSAVTFNSLENLESGDYVVTWTAVGTDNYNAAEGSKTVEFTVVASDAIPPYTLSVGEVTVNDNRELSISGSLSCEATTSKMVEIIAVYTIEGSGVTNELSIATDIELNGGTFTGMISNLKPGATYSIAVYSKIGEEMSALTEFKTVTVSGEPKNLTAAATFTTKPDKKFIVTGSVTPGIGETKVTLHYSLNSTECNTPSGPVIVGENGAFSFEVDYENISDTFSWYVTVVNTFNKEDTNGEWDGELTGEPTVSVTTTRSEIAQSHYVWTGNGDNNLWNNPQNWDCDNNESCYGYPGTGVGNSYLSTVAFTNAASVNLNGATVYVNGAIQMNESISVEITDGTLGFQTDTLNLGASNSTLTLKKVRLPYNSSNPSKKYTIKPGDGSIVIIDGDNSMPSDAYAHLMYSPTTAGKLVIKNFDGRTFISSDEAVEGSIVELDNARWNLRTGEGDNNTGLADKGLPKKMIFKDGANRRAIVRSLWHAPDDDYYSKINLDGRTFDIKLAEKIETDHTANIVASALSGNASCVFNVDVTDYKDGQPVRILRLDSRADNLNFTWTATANGVDVKEKRNAKLEWQEGFLCYVQDTYNEAVILRHASNQWGEWIDNIEYSSFADAVANIQAGDTVKLLQNVDTDAAFEITKKVTIDLNGKTIAATEKDTEGNGVFWVKADGELTITDSSEEQTGVINGVGNNDWNMAIWADGGKVIINGGTYTNEGAQDDGPDGAHFDLIYVKNGGAVEINGGMFKCETPRWTLNIKNGEGQGTITVNAGKFYGFNPADCKTDDFVSYCADGLTAVLNEETGYYEIVDAWSAPMPDIDDGDTFHVEYTDEVIEALKGAEGVVDVKVNNAVLKGDAAVKALNDAVACFEDAITIADTTASLDIEIKVTEINAAEPEKSTVVVKRGTEELTVKVTPTVKYFYSETKTWGSNKPESGAVLFKLVFEAPSAN